MRTLPSYLHSICHAIFPLWCHPPKPATVAAPPTEFERLEQLTLEAEATIFLLRIQAAQVAALIAEQRSLASSYLEMQQEITQ